MACYEFLKVNNLCLYNVYIYSKYEENSQKQAVFFQNLSKKNFDLLPKKSFVFHESTQKHFSHIVEIRDIESLIKKDWKVTKISVKH